jgi:cytoskeleton protein RodZ
MEAIGERLRRKREELGLTLEQAAEATKFPPEIIVAVEDGRVGIFSAKVYHIAFIRAYARLLKLDADQLIRDQKSEEERAQEALRGIRPLPPRTRVSRRTMVTIAAVVAAAIILLVISNLAFREKPERSGEKTAGAGETAGSVAGGRMSKAAPNMIRVETPPEEAASEAGAPRAAGGGSETGLETGSGVGAAAGARAEPGAPLQAGLGQAVPDSAAADSTKPAGPAIVPGTSWPIIPASPGRGEGRTRTLVLTATGGALVTLASGDSTLFEGRVTGGDARTFTSRKPFVVVFLSDRNAVALSLDGKPVVLPESGKRQVFDYTLP